MREGEGMGEKEGEWEWEEEGLSNIETRSESWKVCVCVRENPFPCRFGFNVGFISGRLC